MKSIYCFLFVVGLFLFSGTIYGQEEEQMQSAFIYHFTKYMEWPSGEQNDKFTIAVVGDDAIVAHLNKLATIKKVGVKSILVKTYRSADQVANCDIIFLSSKESFQIQTCVNKVKEFNALLITEKSGYAKKGSGINFVIIDGKSKFEINEAAIEASGIKVSAKLVHLGVKIR